MNAQNREAIEKRLQEIFDREGSLTADAVIKDAKSKDSPLHSEFEWDVNKAAMETWRSTARAIIRSVKVIVRTEHIEKVVPAYVRNPEAKPNVQSYSRTAELRTDNERSIAALAYELERVEASIRRARDVALSLGLEKEIDQLLMQVLDLKQKNKKAA